MDNLFDRSIKNVKCFNDCEVVYYKICFYLFGCIGRSLDQKNWLNVLRQVSYFLCGTQNAKPME